MPAVAPAPIEPPRPIPTPAKWSRDEAPDAVAPLAYTADDLARLLQCSKRHLAAMHSSGRLPRPIRLGRSVRWRADELRAWLDAGAPARDRWEAMRQRNPGGAR